MNVLIIDDDPATLEYMGDSIENFGHTVATATDGRLGLKEFYATSPDLVISDIEMRDKDGLWLLESIRQENSEVPVIMATAFGCEDYAVQALRLGADGYLSKPLRHKELQSLLTKYAERHHDVNCAHHARKMVTKHQLTMVVDNVMRQASHVAKHLVSEAIGAFDPSREFSIYLGLYELIVNAIEHGNLEISYEDRRGVLREKAGRLSEFLSTRQSDPEFAQRRVTIEYHSDSTGCEWLIKDDGPGFDWRAYLESIADTYPTHAEQRGILLNQMRFDELEYIGAGNIVRAKIHASEIG